MKKSDESAFFRRTTIATVLLGAVACSASSAPERVATTSSDLAVAGLFATGVDAKGAALAAGTVDPHYTLSSNDPSFRGPDALAVAANAAWTADTATSSWISIRASTAGAKNGVYTYTTTFTLAANPTTATLQGSWAADDSVTLTLNGKTVAARGAEAYGSATPFRVPAGSPFQIGTNTLAFVTVNSGGGPTGLQVTALTGSVAQCVADAQCAAGHFCDTATNVCTATLANGVAVPTVPGHTPPLTGLCTLAAGAAVCASGVCDTGDNLCGYADGDGLCVAGAAPVCRSGECSVATVCEPAGGCERDGDCAAGQWCDESTTACAAQLANGTTLPVDASHTSPTLDGECFPAAATLVCVSGVCDTDDNECGYADGDGPCDSMSAGVVCRSQACSVDGTCEPAGGCNVDGDCAGTTPDCDPTTQLCVAAPGGATGTGSTVTVTATGPTSVDLTWTPSTDPAGVTTYDIYENGTLVATASGSTLGATLSGLDPGTPYTFSVTSVDPGGASTTGPSAAVFCTPADVCHLAGTFNSAGGTCTPGGFVTLDDGDPCTLDTCDPVNGVVHHACSSLDPTVSTVLASSAAFLYSGTDPVQTDVAPGTIAASTIAVVQGHVYGEDGSALPGAAVTVVNHPELGSTLTQGDGGFDMAVNGGQTVRLHIALATYLPAERVVQAPWQDYVTAADVVLVQLDPQVTGVDLSDMVGMQVARGTPSIDSDGTRQATVLVPPGTQATMTLPDGTTSPLTSMQVRATEYTLGPSGPSRMPAPLPPTSGYTYAVQLSADEELAAGATELAFSPPLPFYLENYRGFPVGANVPAGSYDPVAGAWVASPNGVVLQILSVTGGEADLDLDGDGVADTGTALTSIGITDLERQELAVLYAPGQTLWRVPIPHFSPPWDLNMGGGPPVGSGPPGGPPPAPDPPGGPGGCKDQNASTITCQRRSLGEDLAIAGTPFTLHYESDRQRGRQPTLNIPVSGSSLVGPVLGLALEVSVGGNVFTQSFPAQTNLTTAFSWNGLDAFGRRLQGGQPVGVRVGNTYSSVYQNVDLFGLSGNGVSFNISGQDITIWQYWNSTMALWDAEPAGFGGWDLDVHHSYDVSGQTLRFGNGDNLTSADVPPVIQTVAGGGNVNSGSNGDGGPATSAVLSSPESVAIGPDGSFYIADNEDCVRRVTPDGIIRTFAGQCLNNGFSGDGGPATAAQLHGPEDLAFGPDGSLYIADTNNQRIRRVFPDGIIQTVAGSGPTGTAAGGFSGDGGPALQAVFQQPWGVDVTADGTIYIADVDNGRIRRVGPDGTVSTVAGNGTNLVSSDVPATATALSGPMKVRVAPDGSFYVAESNGDVVRRVGTDGIIHPFAGVFGGRGGYDGDGGPATAALLNFPMDVAIGPDGSVDIVDQNETVRQVAPNGIISTIVGVAGHFIFGGDNGLAAAATMGVCHGIRIGPDGSLYVADSADSRVRRVQSVLTGFSPAANTISFPSKDGQQVYVFDGSGRHLQTLDAFTGATLYQFAYDSGGRLSSVVDVHGNVTQIQHDGSENLTGIVAPFGEQSVFTPDPSGYLAAATDAAGQTTQFTYDTGGLMQTKTDARGALSEYSYDAIGRLSEDQDPAGGSKTLASTVLFTGSVVSSTTALGLQSVYQTTTSSGVLARLNTLPSGLQSSLQFTPSSVTTVTVPDGTVTTTADTPDPRVGFGILAPMPSVTTTTPSGLTSVQSTTRSVTNNANGLLATFLEQTSLNGNTWTRLFDAGSLTWTATSPMGRQTVTTLNAQGQPVQTSVPNVTPVTFVYDSQGRITSMSQGPSRTWTMSYDPSGYVASMTDPLGNTVSYQNDPLGRALQTVLPDGRVVGTVYDPDGNTTVVTTPADNAHDFAYTPVELLASYTPPSIGTGLPSTQYDYDVDRRLTSVTQPDAVALAYGYDFAGRLSSTTYPQGVLSRSYDPATGHLTAIASPGGETLAYSYDGFLRTGLTWSGLVPGAVTFGFDSSFRITSQTVDGQAIALGYDADSLLTQAGDLTVSRDPENGRVTGTTLGLVTDAYAYDGNGLFATYVASYNGNPLYSESVVRDPVGRITQKTEVIGSTTHVWGYTFDTSGRLTDVTEDGNFASHYGYDADDNRTTFTNTSGTVNPTYDVQDRLLTYGGASYAYTANGELTSKADGSGTTGYTYDALGNLLHVTLPSGTNVDYVVDGENRRVGKSVNATLTAGFLYQDALKAVAQLDGSGNLVARFVFGSKANVPDYYTTSTGTFRVLSDHLGSPRLVVDTASGSVVEEIDYDEFGNVVNDTSPGSTPFGFAGGLYDTDTGLVRFGARDYDESVGRWTSKDPLGFNGGMNLYGYALNDPVSAIDPDGTDPGDVMTGGLLSAVLDCMTQCPSLDFACLASCVAADFGPAGAAGGGGGGPNICPDPNPCPPCPTPPPDQVHNVPNQHGCPNGHVHYFKYNQNPQTCTCYLQRLTRCL